MLSGKQVCLAVTGSAGLGVAKASGLNFVQEVYATAAAVNAEVPDADAVIELGGEDAKIIFFGGALEERMNGSCAGGTGAFIDQMATLMDVSIAQLDELSCIAKRYTNRFPLRGFCKSDIQPILNQGGRRRMWPPPFSSGGGSDGHRSHPGRELKGKIVFLGGPLHFLKGLRLRFMETLRLDERHAVFPKDGTVLPQSARLSARTPTPRPILTSCIGNWRNPCTPCRQATRCRRCSQARRNTRFFLPGTTPPRRQSGYRLLFRGRLFGNRRGQHDAEIGAVTPDGGILYSYYQSNRGNLFPSCVSSLRRCMRCAAHHHSRQRGNRLRGGLDQNAFCIDMGLVETMAHYAAARHFCPDVDFIIDIGGQDMKCFKSAAGGGVHHAQRGLFFRLRVVCRDLCRALGYEISEFAKLGLYAPHPADLGSRCTCL
jgi:activator of 2-hydroxyglutaryl-CoA dehydratase